jgi:phosphoglucosamine mutase
MKTYFGTDGVRGRANTFPMTPEVALRLGRAAGQYFRRGSHRHSVVIGKDTRLSCYMIEAALTAGFTSSGMDVSGIGPAPTPAVGILTRSMRADLGVMITASHNGFEDNGIKLFGPDGFKLPDEAELEIETMMGELDDAHLANPGEIGQVRHFPDAKGRYAEIVKSAFPRGLRLDGVKVVIDCANGAAYRVAPQTLWELGADITVIGANPNGLNINQDCGSTKPEALSARVREVGADIGIALDGDGDRVILADENGVIIDGDKIMARVVKDQMDRSALRGGGVVGTVMSNLGFERFVNDLGITLHRAPVGDRYVVERMRSTGINIGGEPSGHIVLTDHATTGDGMIAALQVLAACVRNNRPVSELCDLFEKAPQILKNVRYAKESPLNTPPVKQAIEDAMVRLNGRGRLLVRASGTEPLIRVMAEGDDLSLVEAVVDQVADTVASASQGDKPAAAE